MNTLPLRSIAALLLLVGSLAHANIVEDPGFDSGITGTWSTQSRWGGSNLQNGTGVAAANAFIYDDGWTTFNNGTADLWTVSGGVAVRTANQNRFNPAGIGQIVSNPNNGTFDNGDLVTFAFDYIFTPVNNTSVTLSASVYGIDALNGTGTVWNLAGGNAIEGFGLSGSTAQTINASYTAGSDYKLELIHNFTLSAAASGSYHSGTFTLGKDYELFAIVFQAADKQSVSSGTSIDNVSFAAIPEPSSLLLAGLGLAGILLGMKGRR